MSLPSFPRRVVILGATGSIGAKALAVARRYPEKVRVVGLAAAKATDALAEAARQHPVERVVVADPAREKELRAKVAPPVVVESGTEAVTSLARWDEADLVVNAVVGRAGLEASLAAARAGKMLALANKESLVLAGELLLAEARRAGATVIPVDSEHSAIFQCLDGRRPEDVSRVILTASGGPFRGKTREQLRSVTPEQALRHPIWPMGPRITVDSATLFNKGIEVIEAARLFPVPLERIGVWVHPQSVVHGLVEMVDGSLLAQLSVPDMLLPVQYAMSYPQRWEADVTPARLPDWKSLTFEEPDAETFPALGLAVEAAARGGTAPAVLNAADEVAVQAFLEGRIPFLSIAEVLAETLADSPVVPADSLEAVAEADRRARRLAEDRVAARAR